MSIFNDIGPDDRPFVQRIRAAIRRFWDKTAHSLWSWIKLRFWALFDNFDLKYVARLFIWSVWKNIQIFVRSYLSHFIAILLAVLVLIRESPEFIEIIHDYTTFIWYWHGFIISVTLATILAAIWELRGNKISTTQQERRFVLGVRNLLIELEKFKATVKISQNNEDRQAELKALTETFIEIASGAICGKKHVDVGVLMYADIDGVAHLSLYGATPGAHYKEGFCMPLQTLADDQKGPAYMSFTTGHIAHMPNKADKFGYVFEEIKGEKYRFRDHIEGWFPVDAEYEDYRSVLSVPVSSYVDAKKRDVFGVLSFTTSFRDPFIQRDYIMALSLANLLGQAIVALNEQKDTRR